MGKKEDKKVGISKAEVKYFYGNLINREIPLTDIPSKSTLFALYGYKGLASACIDVIANSVASNEWYLLKPKNKSKKEIEEIILKNRRPLPDELANEDDEIYKLLLKPNPIFDWYEHIQFHQVFMEIKGESYWYLAKDGLGRVKEIWLIPPFFVNPVKSVKKNTHPYEIERYDVMTATGVISVNPEDMIYFRNPNPYNPLRGIGTLEKAMIERDLNVFSKLYARNFFKNGGIPAGILVTDQKLPEDELEELKRIWKDTYGGLDNSWKIAFLWGGWRYQEISVDPSAREFERLGEWSRDDLLAVFGVPASKLGIVKDVNRANALVNDITFAKETILPRLKKLESKINYELFPKIGANGYYIIFKDPTPQNIEVNIRKLRYGAMFGILTLNEARELIGLPPLPDGDNIFVQPLKDMEEFEMKEKYENLDRIVERIMEEEDFDY